MRLYVNKLFEIFDCIEFKATASTFSNTNYVLILNSLSYDCVRVDM